MSDPLPDSTRFTGGEISGPLKERYEHFRSLLNAQDDCHRVVNLQPVNASEPAGPWLYLVETSFATYPRFVVGRIEYPEGRTDAHVKILLLCGAEWSAQDYWQNLTARAQ